jgi:hypothetical protein
MIQEALDAADEVIAGMKKHGLDYTKHRDTIALAFDEGLLEGNNEATVDVEGDETVRNLRIIQEDHYDQHMDEDEDVPEWDKQLCYVVIVPAYVWFS